MASSKAICSPAQITRMLSMKRVLRAGTLSLPLFCKFRSGRAGTAEVGRQVAWNLQTKGRHGAFRSLCSTFIQGLTQGCPLYFAASFEKAGLWKVFCPSLLKGFHFISSEYFSLPSIRAIDSLNFVSMDIVKASMPLRYAT